MIPIKEYTEANRAAWNEAMPLHQAANEDKWDKKFSESGYSVIKSQELDQLQALGVSGKNIAHVCCNNGVELMSLKNLGANRCVGFDISDEAIDEARTRSERFHVDCEFVRTDVYEIDSTYDGHFDVVYISIGCLGWMPDLNKFIHQISQLLKGSGHIFIHEKHPFSDMLPCDRDGDADPLKIIEPYFKKDPYIDNDGIDYIGNTTYESQTMYWFVWTLSDIFMAIVDAGFTIQFFGEYKDDISESHSKNEHAGIDIPLSYILTAGKAAK
ncbi:MAG: class I SAM-dependent methyltransferase [Akkermansiaceae bacterium]